MVWLLAVAALFWLGRALPPTGSIRAIADARSSAVSPPVDGRVQTLLVNLHQDVEAGTVVARLDDRDVRLRLNQAGFELERLRADMAREELDRQQDARNSATGHELESGAEQRRLATAVETFQLAALTTRTQLEEARVRLQGAAVEAERQSQLGGQGMIGQPEVVRWETERGALQKRVSELENLLAEQRARTETAQQRLRDFAPGQPTSPALDVALAPMRWRLKDQEAQLERIAHAAQQLDLRAPISGRVVDLRCHPGEWAIAGTPLLTIVDPRPRRIRAYVPESVRSTLQPEQNLRVQRQDGTELGAAPILSISPSVVQLPERLWRDPSQAEWGYELVVAAIGGEIPGERLLLAPSK
ncbi:MAG: HlyD family efflux transporter periplasmic adaptor subunit [Planctomycetes bacterium]|nr:HlyD family efflux transporter periplasmic adaptor subunit [Planctomycetota bacterium]